MERINLTGNESKTQLLELSKNYDISVNSSDTKDDILKKIEDYNLQSTTISSDSKYTVNERFDFLHKLTSMVSRGKANSLIVLGDGGLGKSTTVMNAIQESGISKEDYYLAKGYSTARGMYNILFDHNGKLIIFDDCDSVLDDKTSVSVLKSALDSHDQRVVTWASKMMKGEIYPSSFEFTGRIIFISNRNRNSIPQPITDRSYVVDLELNNEEKLERMSTILPNLVEKNNWSLYVGIKAFEFIKENQRDIKKMSIRTLLDVVRIINDSADDEWKGLAEYTIKEGQR